MNPKKKVLAIGPHPDDIELSCFGTMCRLAAEGHEIHFLVLSRGEGGSNGLDRTEEAKASAALLACTLHLENLPDRYMSDGMETITVIEKYVNEIGPDMVFLPSGNDVHQDHRAVHYASLVAVRLIDEVYLYQAPSTTMGFAPSVYFDITDYVKTKVQAVKIHTSQGGKVYMADRAVEGLAEYRAFDIFRNDRFMEAFEPLRIVR
ncbi:PIG-L family deacetylase [Candidatus Gracilibacteria bacterium]|nr:PIG-L family deacetylase [Candidatus Gracilibacteria bacterium]